MTTFVLVHGAWHGGWCWSRVRSALQAQGHQVFTPTLTGVGQRSHLMSRDVNLSTHIEDIAAVLQWEDLNDVVLCGHSYGGCVISGVADRMPGRIRHLVYLDAFVPENGENLLQHAPLHADLFLAGAREAGEGYKMPPIPAVVFNVNEADRALVDARCTMHPLAAFQEKIKLAAPAGNGRPATYVLATDWEGSPFPAVKQRAVAKGWRTVDMNCGHDVMLDRPAELTALLAAL